MKPSFYFCSLSLDNSWIGKFNDASNNNYKQHDDNSSDNRNTTKSFDKEDNDDDDNDNDDDDNADNADNDNNNDDGYKFVDLHMVDHPTVHVRLSGQDCIRGTFNQR